MAGRESRFERDWLDLADRLGIKDRIRRIGYVGQEDLPHLYEKAAALLYVSCYEGFGFPPLEAMEHGLPVIASSHSSLPEVVGAAGVFVAPDDVEGIADSIRRVLEDPSLRQRLREKGKMNLERFSWRNTARKTLEVYEKVLAEDVGREPC
jgi:glycosyltransferase involved in cell wall biosynthesis